jgi:hypothetical protein
MRRERAALPYENRPHCTGTRQMTVYCLYHTRNGTSNIVPLTLKLPDGQTRGGLFVDREAFIMDGTAPRPTDWHCTPALAVSIILKGQLDIEVNKSAPRLTQLCAGDAVIVLDHKISDHCEGHKGLAHGPTGMTALVLKLAAADVPALAANFADWPADIAL